MSIEILNQIKRSEREAEEIVARAREAARATVERARSDSAQRIDSARDAESARVRKVMEHVLSEVEEEIARREKDMGGRCEALRARAEEHMPEAVAAIIERIMG